MKARFGQLRRVSVAPMMATVGLIGVTAAVVGGLAFATFTSTTSVTQNVNSGTVAFASLTPSGTGQRLSVAATDIAPGDTIQRAVTLTNTGSINMDASAVRLTTSATTSSLLDTGGNGLTMTIDKCSVAWTESAFPYTYTCGGTTTTVLASSPVIGTNVALANIVTTPATPNHLRVTLTLPTAADNTYQNQTSVISYSFAGTQRAGTDR
mgnify:CR=1 FL=1|jgi:spore coat-associated protein N